MRYIKRGRGTGSAVRRPMHMPGTRFVFVSGLLMRGLGLRLPRVSVRLEPGYNTDCFAYDIRRVRRALRRAPDREWLDTLYRYTGNGYRGQR
jgi:hypothetical protein